MRIDDLALDVMPQVMGCPSPTVERAVLDTLIAFCDRTCAYQVEQDAAPAPVGVGEVDLEIPSQTRLVKVMSVQLGNKSLQPAHRSDLDTYGQNWRTLTGTPGMYVKLSETAILLVPYLTTSSSDLLNVRFAVAPARTATAIADDFINRYRDTVVAGALQRLLEMAGVSWADPNAAARNGMRYVSGTRMALLDVGMDWTTARRSVVTMRSF